MTEYPGGDLLAAAGRARVGRRSLLRGAGAAMFAAPLLAACGEGGSGTEASLDRSEKEKLAVISNRPGFDDKKPPTGTVVPVKQPFIPSFSASTGIRVNYKEDITDDEQYLAKATDALKSGKGIGRDLLVLPGWLAAHAVEAGLVRKFDHVNLWRVRLLAEPFQSSVTDPQRDYTIPWAAGITGIAYNSAALAKPVETVEQLLTDRALRGRVTGPETMRDMLGLIIAQLGDDPAAATAANVSAALAKLAKAVKAKQFFRFTGGEYVSDLLSGRARAAVASSLDVPKLQAANPDIKFVVPEAGGLLWTRDAFVPKGATHQTNVETLLNELYRPEIWVRFGAVVQSVSTVHSAREEMAELKPALAENPLIFPDAALLARLSPFVHVDAKTSAAYGAAYRSVTAD